MLGSIEELVGLEEEGKRNAAFRSVRVVTAPGRTPDVVASGRHALRIHERSLQYVGLLELDMLAVGKDSARRETRERGQQTGLLVLHEHFDLHAFEARGGPRQGGDINVSRGKRAEAFVRPGVRGHGGHRVLLEVNCAGRAQPQRRSRKYAPRTYR